MIQYNKLYQSLKKISAEWHAGNVLWEYSWNYIKFFEDNTFIYSSIRGNNIELIGKWFNQDAENVIRGKYLLKSNSQLSLEFESGKSTLAGFTNDGDILVEGIQTWELFSPVD